MEVFSSLAVWHWCFNSLIYQSQTILTSLLSQSLGLVISAKTCEVKSLIFIRNIQSVSVWRWMGLFLFLRNVPSFLAVLRLDLVAAVLILKGRDQNTEIKVLFKSPLCCFQLPLSKSQYCWKHIWGYSPYHTEYRVWRWKWKTL